MKQRDCPMRPVPGATMEKLLDVECQACGRRREEYLRQPPAERTVIDCPTCGKPTPHRRVWSLQGNYTYRTPDSPSHAGKRTCVIGEN